MRTEAEIRAALVNVLLGNVKHTTEEDMAVIRILSWVLDMEIKECSKCRPKRLKKAVSHDYFPA